MRRRLIVLFTCVLISLGTAVGLSGSATAAAGGSRLSAGERLNPGEQLVSPDGRYVLQMQTDGNLAQYAPGHRAVWSSKTSAPNSILIMQRDGNLVIIAPGNHPVWATNTKYLGSYLDVQNDGNFVVYAPRVAWSSFEHGSVLAATTCERAGAGGWRFKAHVSENDGLVLDESSLNGRTLTRTISVPYLEATYTTGQGAGTGQTPPVGVPPRPPADKTTKLELVSPGGQTHAGVPGVLRATLVGFECATAKGTDDIYVRAIYNADDESMYAGTSTKFQRSLEVTQEYRFRAPDSHACEPTAKLSCARFWPSISYNYSTPDPQICQRPRRQFTGCTIFSGLRTVQRLEFRPDNATSGAIDAFYDLGRIESAEHHNIVKTKGSDGSMKYEDIDQAIRAGKRGDWDSIHQSPTGKTSGPGLSPLDPTPGCANCVHMHWYWGTLVNNVTPNFTDGEPELRDNSTQDADFGIVRYNPGEEDPVANGWRSLVDKQGSDASKLRGYGPVIFWDMSSHALSDAAFPVLDNYKHGGNGALFFGTHRK